MSSFAKAILLASMMFGLQACESRKTVEPTRPSGIICPSIYAPVCAKITLPCFKDPCPTKKKTFGNRCELSADKTAQYLYSGACNGL